jgi:glyoxylase I family protein
MTTGLAHICFSVRDLDVSLAFYRDVLGLPHAFDLNHDEDGRRLGSYLHAGGRVFIELFPGEPGARGGSYQHFCLEVDNIEATVAQLREAGTTVSDPVMGIDHSWQAWLKDPDGNSIELHSYTPDSNQFRFLQS